MKKSTQICLKSSRSDEKGITLIALVITIIVLLILAGVSVALIAGENGILNRATNAVSKHTEEAAREKLNLALQALKIDKMAGEKINIQQTLEQEGFVMIEDIVIVEDYQFMIDQEKLEIIDSLGKGVENTNIEIIATPKVSEDKMTCRIEVNINYTGEISKVMINGQEAQAENGIYVAEVKKNGKYTIFVKDNNNGYKMANIEVTGLIGYIEEIWTVADLEQFRDGVNAGLSYEGRTVKLKADLDLVEIENWEPIGYYASEEDYKAFKGIFDGEEHRINHLKTQLLEEGKQGVGFFGLIQGAVIKNMKFENVSIYSETEGTAVVVAYSYGNSTIENIETLSGQVNATVVVGGICGMIDRSEGEKKASIKNCSNHVTIIASDAWVGGICGDSESDCIIENCYNTGDVTSGGPGVAGILGVSTSKGKIYNCYNSALIRGGKGADGGGYQAGVIGYMGYLEAANFEVKNCYNLGDIENDKNGRAIGGIAGVSYGIVEKSYNLGTVTGTAEHVGGIVGLMRDNAEANDCYNLGEVINNSTKHFTGGIVGLAEKGKLEQCYNAANVTSKGEWMGGLCGRLLGATMQEGYISDAIIVTFGTKTVTGSIGKRL